MSLKGGVSEIKATVKPLLHEQIFLDKFYFKCPCSETSMLAFFFMKDTCQGKTYPSFSIYTAECKCGFEFSRKTMFWVPAREHTNSK